MTARLLSGDRILEPATFELQIERAAAAMAAMGIEAGDAVALLLRNDFPFFVASLAARKIGAFATPINWHSTTEEVRHVVTDSAAKILIGHSDLLARLGHDLGPAKIVVVPTPPEVAAAYDLIRAPPYEAEPWSDWLKSAEAQAPPNLALPTMTMIYTSGTTGRPKGVRRFPMKPEQVAALQKMIATGYGLLPDMRMTALITGPMYHTAPNVYAISASTMADLVILQPRFDAEDLLAQIERHRVTHMHMVPIMFVRLLKLPPEIRRKYDLSSLRFVVHGAAPCPMDVKQKMIAWLGPIIHEYYGATETGLITGHNSEEALRKPGTVGRALPGVTLKILDQTGSAVPPGTVGDVYAATDLPDFTYRGREDERHAIGRDNLVTVGDVGWVDDEGYLFLCDRRRDMIISGGVNIYSAEIEGELLAIDGVRDCAVFGIPDTEFGEAVCAHIESEPGKVLTASGIRTMLGAKLARFKIPKVIEFSDALPREDSGKIFKRLLREPYWARTGRQI